MFKILTLQTDVDAQLQALTENGKYEIDGVDKLGADSSFNVYLLVEYNLATPAPFPQPQQGGGGSTPVSGSVPTSGSNVVSPSGGNNEEVKKPKK